jgi:hypothetical protein
MLQDCKNWTGKYLTRVAKQATMRRVVPLRDLSPGRGMAPFVELPPRSLKFAFYRPPDKAEQEDNHHQRDSHHRGSEVRVSHRKPGEPHRYYVFTQAESDVRHRLGRRRHRCTNRGFGAVCRKGYGRSQEGAQQLLTWRQLGGSAIGQHGRNRHAHESVQCVPYEIESRNFIGDEFDKKKRARRANYIPASERMERWRQIEQAGLRQHSQGGDGGIDIEPGGEAGPYNDGDDLVAAEIHLSLDARPRGKSKRPSR